MAHTLPLKLLGQTVNGDIGGYTCWTDKFGRVVAYAKQQEQDPPSLARALNRARFRWAQSKWAALSQGEKATLEESTRRASLALTGQNLWISASLRNDVSSYDRLTSWATSDRPALITTPSDVSGVPEFIPFTLRFNDQSSTFSCRINVSNKLWLSSPPGGYGINSQANYEGTEVQTPSGQPDPIPAIRLCEWWPPAMPCTSSDIPPKLANYQIVLTVSELAAATQIQVDIRIGWVCNPVAVSHVTTTSSGWPGNLNFVSIFDFSPFGDWSLDLSPNNPPG